MIDEHWPDKSQMGKPLWCVNMPHIIQIGLQSLACELYLLHKGKNYLVHKQSHKKAPTTGSWTSQT